MKISALDPLELDKECRRACNVANDGCTHPPAFAVAAMQRPLQTLCFCCGLPVCRNCSTIRKYYKRYGFVRMCDKCQSDYDGNDDRVMLRQYHKAGYPDISLTEVRVARLNNTMVNVFSRNTSGIRRRKYCR